MNLKVGGLFSGVGGIELAFKQSGFDISWANDMDKNAHITYKLIMKKDHYIAQRPKPIIRIIQNSMASNIYLDCPRCDETHDATDYDSW